MELFRVNRNPWGQEILSGVSWDLLWVFIAAGAAFIVVHIVYMWLWAPRVRRRSGGGGPS